MKKNGNIEYKMTNEEAISYLKWARPINPYSLDKKKVQMAIDMAIEALQENPKLIKEAKKWQAYFEEEVANEW